MAVQVDGSNIFKGKAFGLKKGNVESIQSVFGEGWSNLEAVVFVYAALGIDYSDKMFQTNSHARSLKIENLEKKTRVVCGTDKPAAKRKPKGATKGVAKSSAKGAAKTGAAKKGTKRVHVAA